MSDLSTLSTVPTQLLNYLIFYLRTYLLIQNPRHPPLHVTGAAERWPIWVQSGHLLAWTSTVRVTTAIRYGVGTSRVLTES